MRVFLYAFSVVMILCSCRSVHAPAMNATPPDGFVRIGDITFSHKADEATSLTNKTSLMYRRTVYVGAGNNNAVDEIFMLGTRRFADTHWTFDTTGATTEYNWDITPTSTNRRHQKLVALLAQNGYSLQQKLYCGSAMVDTSPKLITFAHYCSATQTDPGALVNKAKSTYYQIGLN